MRPGVPVATTSPCPRASRGLRRQGQVPARARRAFMDDQSRPRLLHDPPPRRRGSPASVPGRPRDVRTDIVLRPLPDKRKRLPAERPSQFPPTVERMKALTRLIGDGYRGVGDQLRKLLGRPSKTVRRALENCFPAVRRETPPGAGEPGGRADPARRPDDLPGPNSPPNTALPTPLTEVSPGPRATVWRQLPVRSSRTATSSISLLGGRRADGGLDAPVPEAAVPDVTLASHHRRPDRMSPDESERVIRVNLTGPLPASGPRNTNYLSDTSG